MQFNSRESIYTPDSTKVTAQFRESEPILLFDL